MGRHRLVKRSRKFALTALATALVLATLEVVSFTGFHVFEWIRPGSVVEISMAHHFRHKVTPAKLKHFVKYRWDAELGWIVRPFSKRSAVNIAGVTWSESYNGIGARRDPQHYETLLATTFGDSYTNGHEVSDHETWQSYAASELNSAVLNFGMGAYGTLQAVMRAERRLRSGLVAPVTILVIFLNNLERTVMAFRPLKYPDSSMPLAFMPTLRLRDDQLVEFENPWTDPDLTREDLRDLAIAVADYDFWSETKARMSFPFTLAIVRSLYSVFKGQSRTEYYLWDTHEGKEIMKALVKRFVQVVREKGSVPMILFIPGPWTLKSERPALYEAVKGSLREQYADMLILDVAEREFDRSNFNILPFKGHASPYGNRIIADMIVEALGDFEPVTLEKMETDLFIEKQ